MREGLVQRCLDPCHPPTRRASALAVRARPAGHASATCPCSYTASLAARNALAGLRGLAVTATFKVELLCIIDALDHGTLVFRNAKRQILLPPSRAFHWAKRWFEGAYLNKFR